MLVKAKISFAGLVTMASGETREVCEEVGSDLLRAGYAVEVKAGKAKSKKAVSEGEDVGGNA